MAERPRDRGILRMDDPRERGSPPSPDGRWTCEGDVVEARGGIVRVTMTGQDLVVEWADGARLSLPRPPLPSDKLPDDRWLVFAAPAAGKVDAGPPEGEADHLGPNGECPHCGMVDCRCHEDVGW